MLKNIKQFFCRHRYDEKDISINNNNHIIVIASYHLCGKCLHRAQGIKRKTWWGEVVE